MGASRRGLIKAALFGPVAAAPAWASMPECEALFNAGSHDLIALAHKVMPEVPTGLRQSALKAVAKQLQQVGQPSAIATTLQLLHADDVAHGRTLSVYGVVFSHTQVGILASISTTNRGAA